MKKDRSRDVFKIGLCMTGTISAGAYTAGVMDYLLEALEEWQKRKDHNEINSPSHQIEIVDMGGTSAGGMTAIIASAALEEELKPVKKAANQLNSRIQENRLYHNWVDLLQDDMIDVLLDTKDITSYNFESLLNSYFIDQISRRATFVKDVYSPNKKYISKNLRVFVTTSNLAGMHQKIHFDSNSEDFNKHSMSHHSDYTCFQKCNAASEYLNDGWIPLNFKKRINVDLAQRAAMATGAFPIGLKARRISRNSKYMEENSWFDFISKTQDNPFKKSPYRSINIDGGLINNEPFEKEKEALLSI